MVPGVRAELAVRSPPNCELAALSGNDTVRSIQRSAPTGDGVVAEFVAAAPVGDAEKVFDYGSEAVYRLSHDGERPCACECVERLGYPVRDHRVADGTVHLCFFVPDIDALRSVVEELSAEGRRVTIRRLTRSDADAGDELVLVDRGELTDRQLEVLETADRLGYFDHPKAANAGEVADELDISTSTFAEHLSAAQRKLMAAVLDR